MIYQLCRIRFNYVARILPEKNDARRLALAICSLHWVDKEEDGDRSFYEDFYTPACHYDAPNELTGCLTMRGMDA